MAKIIVTPYMDWIGNHPKLPPFVEKGAVMIGVGMMKIKKIKTLDETLLTWIIYQFTESVFVAMLQHGPDDGDPIEQLMKHCHFPPHSVISNTWFVQWANWYLISLIENCSFQTLKNVCSTLPFQWRWK